MNAKQFQDSIKSLWNKYFPNGYCNISPLVLGGGISIFPKMIGDITIIGNIGANDVLTFRSYIHDNFKFNDESTELEIITIEFDGISVAVKTDKKHLYCESHKIRTRKISGTAEDVLAAMEKLFAKVQTEVRDLASKEMIISQEKYINYIP